MGRGGHDKTARNKRTEVQRANRSRQPVQTEINRRRKRLKHFKKHPNSIKGFEELRTQLGLTN